VDHLLQLLAEMVARYEDQLNVRVAQQRAIPRQNCPSFTARQPDQWPARRAVSRILPDKPQPSGQPSQHSIDGEADGSHLRCAFSIGKTR
jgi:hypothetical protein